MAHKTKKQYTWMVCVQLGKCCRDNIPPECWKVCLPLTRTSTTPSSARQIPAASSRLATHKCAKYGIRCCVLELEHHLSAHPCQLQLEWRELIRHVTRYPPQRRQRQLLANVGIHMFATYPALRTAQTLQSSSMRASSSATSSVALPPARSSSLGPPRLNTDATLMIRVSRRGIDRD
jgi:hypothetical protein